MANGDTDMTVRKPLLDDVAIRPRLRIEAAPNDDAYRVTIHVSEFGLVAEAIERDVGAAIHAAANRCARRLSEEGFPVSTGEVLDSLETIDGAGVPTAASHPS